MNPRWNILYRGPLASCNYACGYCPFAKTRDSAAALRDDAARLERFVDWVEREGAAADGVRIGVLFTPWGEGLIHRSYQRALLRLSAMPHVYRAAIQTNLSCRLDWLEETAGGGAPALWCTYHPTETTVGKFAAKVAWLAERGIRHSVGVVGMKEHFQEIKDLRAALPASTYLWINAWKRQADYYSGAEADSLAAIDRLFPCNNQRHPSRGRLCHAGHRSFTVDGDGTARRCHFISQPLGNIHDPGFRGRLSPQPMPCVNDTCGCHIGYVNLPHLGLDGVYGDGILERIPAEPPA